MGYNNIEKEKERHKQYYLKNKERLLKKQNEYYKNNKDIHKAYYERNKERIIEYQNEYQIDYDKTPMARANRLLGAYKQADKIYRGGGCTLTAKWIVENIFSKTCVHCGESDWTKIGCNRLDNSKPHTEDNVEPCCYKCNIKLLKMERNENGKFTKIIKGS